MKTRTLPMTSFLVFVLFCLCLMLAACAKDHNTELTPDRDAAETLAGAMAAGTGGVLDQMNDLCEFLVYDTTEVNNYLAKQYPSRFYTMHKIYNTETNLWTITISKTMGDSLDWPYATAERVYQLGFKNANDEPQKYYVTDSDTARTAIFRITYGRGIYQTRRIRQQLDSLSCDWTITNAHKAYVTINGSYYRAAVDTITSWYKVRTSDHQLQLTLSDITAPRGFHLHYYQMISGSITGTFNALITFITGSAYSETNIERTIDITIGAGRGHISIGGDNYTSDLYMGEILD